VWIVNDGLKCHRTREGKETDIVLKFEELVAILNAETEVARLLAESPN
jgi:hypothetical protein